MEATQAFTEAEEETSSWLVKSSHFGFIAAISAATEVKFAVLKSPMQTAAAERLARSLAVARPMPEAPPVMEKTLPLRLDVIFAVWRLGFRFLEGLAICFCCSWDWWDG